MEPRYPTVHVDVEPEAVELVTSALFDLGATGVEERDAGTLDQADAGAGGRATLVAHFEDAAAADAALAALGGGARRVDVVGDDWREGWRAWFRPSRVGQRLVVRPPWEEVAATPDDVVVVVDPGRAFGTGTHASTRLVLGALDARVRGGERVLDVGSGSGILAVAALLLGAREARCLDVDPEAVRATLETADRNGVAARVRASTDDVAALEARFDVVLANIEAPVLIPMAAALAARVAPGGWLALSGVLAEQADAVATAFAPHLGATVARPAEDGWVALVLAREAA